jgi:hypothetical protein
MREWLRDFEWSDWLMAAGFVLVIIIAFVGIYYDEQAWARYVVTHHCAIKGHTDPRTGVGVGANGQTTIVYISGQTIYACDDGEIIVR